MRICVVGSGGREHALAEVLRRHHEVTVTPGNPGIAGSVPDAPADLAADLYVIGPEGPLVAGLADELRAAGRLVYGPGADGARLEGSKAWMKEVLVEAGVPTARHRTFGEVAPAHDYLDTLVPPFVLKTDGLAGGKGVLVTESLIEARNAVEEYLSGRAFGSAGTTLVIEEGLVGPEVSVFAICDGQTSVLLPAAQDFKRIGEGDVGPNTGGMGAWCPYPAGAELLADVADRFVQPTLDALRARGIDFRGTLFAGLMLTASGPKLLEYNVRFGDPETQALLPLIESDLGALLAEAAEGSLRSQPTWSADAMVTVICAAEGYPQSPRTGDPIEGVEAARGVEGVEIFCAGVSQGADGRLVTAGGRVLNVCGRGSTVAQARERAYRAVDLIRWPGMTVRRDIAAAC